MAHVLEQGGRTGHRNSENRLARDARGLRLRAAPLALVVTGLAVTLTGAPRAGGQQPGGLLSPYAGTAAPAQLAKAAAQPERLAQPRPVGEAPLEAPPPRTIDPFSELHPRLRALGAGVKPPVGTTPIPSKEEEQILHKWTGPFVDPAYTIELIQGRPRLWYLKEVPFRIQVADENIMTYNIVGQTPREISLLGRQVGVTVLNLWFGDRQDLAKQTVLSFQINVLPDPEEK